MRAERGDCPALRTTVTLTPNVSDRCMVRACLSAIFHAFMSRRGAHSAAVAQGVYNVGRPW